MTTQRKADLLLVLITGFWGCSYYLSDLALVTMEAGFPFLKKKKTVEE